jgi:flagellin-like hook-associated protein FlgL
MKIHNVKYLSSYSDRMLSKHQSSISGSIRKVSSGSRVINSSDDAGLLSIQLRSKAATYSEKKSNTNLVNGISFLEMQDSVLNSAQKIISRMAELKSLSINDPIKSEQDFDSYNLEFQELQIQLHQLSKEKFNGTSLFATTTQTVGGNEVKFRGNENEDHTFNISAVYDSITVSIQKLSFIDSLKIINSEPSVEENLTVELNPTTDLEMIRVEPGTFTRRGNDVTISKEFYMGKYEITQEQWQAVMTGNDKGISLNPSPISNHSPNNPVEGVKLDDVQVFIERLNEQQSDKLPDGWEYDLPDELEWEYAARAGTVTAYSWGDSIDSTKANYNWDAGFYNGIDHNKVIEVGQYDPNPWGLYDMHGNALEWTDTVQNGRFILSSGAYYSQPHEITSSSRYWAPSSSSAYRGVGFRLALKKKSSDTPAINSNDRITAANEERKNVLKLTDFQSSYFDQAIENISYLRSVTSATSSRLQLTHDLSQQVNFSSNNAFSKIVDVDYAAESTHLAKQKIMKNASTAMIAQANGLAEIALIFLN